MRQRRVVKGVQTQGSPATGSGAASAVAELAPDSEAAGATTKGSALGLSSATRGSAEEPINEWGLYDPDLAGIGALISSIDIAELPVSRDVEENPSDLLLRQEATPDSARPQIFHPGSPFDDDGALRVTAAAAVASCRVGHLAPLSLWARVVDADETRPRRATPGQLDSLLTQWLFTQRSRRNHRYASSDLAARIGELTHPAHVALTGLAPVCRIRGIRTAPIAVSSHTKDDVPGWAEPAFTPVPDTIAVEYLQASDAEREAACADHEAHVGERAAPAVEEAVETVETLYPVLEVAPTAELEVAPVQEIPPEPVPDETPAIALEAMPEPVFETVAESSFEDAIERAAAVPVGIGAGPEPLYAMADRPAEGANDGRDGGTLAEFDAVAVVPPAFDAIPLDFMMAQAPTVDVAGFDAVSFDRGMATPIELEPLGGAIAFSTDPAIIAFPVEAESPVVPVSPEPAAAPASFTIEAAPVVAEEPQQPPAVEAACVQPAPEVVEPPAAPRTFQPPVKKRRRTALALG